MENLLCTAKYRGGFYCVPCRRKRGAFLLWKAPLVTHVISQDSMLLIYLFLEFLTGDLNNGQPGPGSLNLTS